jgi:putative PIN family toxin of toxin-antitoxin system
MRVVVDTNVFVSAAFKTSSWPGAVVRWVDESGGLLKSGATEQELFMVLRRPRIAQRANPFFVEQLHRIFLAATLVVITERISACRDTKDNKFLELAANGRADVIVSGDADLLALDPFRGIPIMSPAVFGYTNKAGA